MINFEVILYYLKALIRTPSPIHIVTHSLCLYEQLDSRDARRKGLQLLHGVDRPQLVFLYLSVQMMENTN